MHDNAKRGEGEDLLRMTNASVLRSGNAEVDRDHHRTRYAYSEYNHENTCCSTLSELQIRYGAS